MCDWRVYNCNLHLYLNHYTRNIILYNSFWGCWYLVWAICPLLLWAYLLELETSSNCCSVRVHDLCEGSWPLPRLLIIEVIVVSALGAMNGSPDWKLPTLSGMEPLKRQRSLNYARLCQEGEKCRSQCRLFYSQARQLPCARHTMLSGRNGAPKEAEERYVRVNEQW